MRNLLNCIVATLLLLPFPSPGFTAELSGFVFNQAGLSLAGIDVTASSGNFSESTVTDGYGRYQFAGLETGNYQIAFEDNNFIFDTNEDPYPNEGLLYDRQIYPQPVQVTAGGSVELNNLTLNLKDPTDERIAETNVGVCDRFGAPNESGTLAFALETARTINFSCTGRIAVPEIVIYRDTTINGSDGLTLSGNSSNGLFRTMPGIRAEVSNLSLEEGKCQLGCAILNRGHAIFTDVAINDNQASTAAIYNIGSMDIKNASMNNNWAGLNSILVNKGVFKAENINIGFHVSSGGPLIWNSDGALEFNGCEIREMATNNTHAISNSAKMTITDCKILDSGRTSLFLNQGRLFINRSDLSNNAGDQPLIDNSGSLQMDSTSITGNDTYGVIIYNDGDAQIVNTTISGNSSGAGGDFDLDGAVTNAGAMRIYNSTIANNSGYVKGQIGNAGELRVSNTIITGKAEAPECRGVSPIISEGYNLHTDGSCNPDGSTDISNGNAGLIGLNNNGGNGQSHALDENSDAIDNGDCSGGQVVVDQRGRSRPQGIACDIGAFEADIQSDNQSSGSGNTQTADADDQSANDATSNANDDESTTDEVQADGSATNQQGDPQQGDVTATQPTVASGDQTSGGGLLTIKDVVAIAALWMLSATLLRRRAVKQSDAVSTLDSSFI